MGESLARPETQTGSPYRVAVIAALMVVSAMAGVAAYISPAQAKPEYLGEFNKKYGTAGTRLDSCQTCHSSSSPSAENLNPYGADVRKNNHDFGAIEPLDSDGDGFTNIDEIKALTFPGDPKDNPNAKAAPKPAPTTTTTAPFPFSVLPNLPPPLGK
jgi:hypothetical protein